MSVEHINPFHPDDCVVGPNIPTKASGAPTADLIYWSGIVPVSVATAQAAWAKRHAALRAREGGARNVDLAAFMGCSPTRVHQMVQMARGERSRATCQAPIEQWLNAKPYLDDFCDTLVRARAADRRRERQKKRMDVPRGMKVGDRFWMDGAEYIVALGEDGRPVFDLSPRLPPTAPGLSAHPGTGVSMVEVETTTVDGVTFGSLAGDGTGGSGRG